MYVHGNRRNWWIRESVDYEDGTSLTCDTAGPFDRQCDAKRFLKRTWSQRECWIRREAGRPVIRWTSVPEDTDMAAYLPDFVHRMPDGTSYRLQRLPMTYAGDSSLATTYVLQPFPR
jgi:hypothetical protein